VDGQWDRKRTGNSKGRGEDRGWDRKKTGNGKGRGEFGEGRGQPRDDRKRRNPGNEVTTKKKQLEKLNNDNYISLSNSELG